jgi:hypothetical protein
LHVDLPSGHHAELRDDLLRGDVRFAKKAMKIRVSEDRSYITDPSLEDDVTGALLYRMIVSWDIGQSVPRQAQTLDLAQGILDLLPDEDYKALAQAVRPFYLRVMERPAEEEGPKEESGNTVTSSSGVPALNGPANPSTTDIST